MWDGRQGAGQWHWVVERFQKFGHSRAGRGLAGVGAASPAIYDAIREGGGRRFASWCLAAFVVAAFWRRDRTAHDNPAD